MNRKNVKIGDKFTTMTKFYKALELPNVKGNAKIAQDKEIARWFDLQPTGTNKRAKNEFVVVSIRDIPIQYEEERGKHSHIRMRKSSYGTYMQDLIMYMLDDECEVVDTYYNIMNDFIQLTSKLYQDTTMNGVNLLMKSQNLGKGVCMNYIYKMKTMIKNDYEKAVRNLAKQGYIDYKQCFKVVRNYDIEATLLDDDETISNIILTEKWAYDEFEIKPSDRVDPTINKKFKKLVVKNLDDDTIFNYWKVECIYRGDNYDQYTIIEKGEIETIKKELIKLYIVQIHKSILRSTIPNEYGVDTKPYTSDNNIFAMMKLDLILWAYNDIRDYENLEFTTQIFNDVDYYNNEDVSNQYDDCVPF